MLEFPRWKIIMVCFVCAWAVYMAVPNFLSKEQRESLGGAITDKQINLGLDLQGGSYYLLEVGFKEYMEERKEQLVDDIRSRFGELKKEGKERIGYKRLSSIANGARFELRDLSDKDTVLGLFAQMNREVSIDVSDAGVFSFTFREAYVEDLKRNVLEQSIEVVRRRVDGFGMKEPIIQRQGINRILLQIPGENINFMRNGGIPPAKLTFHLMDENNPYPLSKVTNTPPGTKLLEPDDETDAQFYLIKRRVLLGGESLVDARATYQNGQPVISFRFNSQGGRTFANVTAENVGKPFAIVLDGKVLTAPRINEPILGGSGVISGSFTLQQASDLAVLLRAGALPAPLHLVEERTVGPSLGQDSINSGRNAAMIGFAMVIVTMFVIYRRFGLYCNIALMVNLLLVLACLSLFGATLTLPGIAGLVLTLGMAVDANVLIFERIKEEVRVGRTPFAAIDMGFRHAFKTIIDSNITTLIAAIILFMFGTGAVRGFAVTLSIGILCSMFSAILLTRMMIVLWLKKNKPKTIPL